MSKPLKSSLELILGTAMWGWTIKEEQCYAILDEFYQLGGRRIDSATNYPINKNASDFRRAEQILAKWCAQNKVDDLEVIMKVGSLNNLMTPDQNLSPSFLLICAEEYSNLFGANLHCLMIHWDNRSEAAAIRSSLETLQTFSQGDLQIGLSGIRHPQVYAEILADLQLEKTPVELKHNLLYSDYERYAPLQARAEFLAYGINAGGLKLDANAYTNKASLLARGGTAHQHQDFIKELQELLKHFSEKSHLLETPDSMNQLGMLYAAYHPGIKGALLGPSSVKQLQNSHAWLQELNSQDYAPLYIALVQLSK